MSISTPSPPDPTATAQAQAKYNTQAAVSQAYLNNVNQTTPYGSETYSQSGTAPDGTPTFTATQQLNPAEQKLFDTTVGTQSKIAGDAGQLADNLGSSLTQAPDLSNSALINTMMGWQHDYMQPIFDQQQSNLNSQLQNQGITQGSQAYNNAQNLQSRNVNNAYESALANDEGQAYNQAVTSYQLPISTLASLLGEGAPANMTSSLTQTPQEQIQPPNYQGLVEQNYQQQLNQNQNMMSGIFKLAGTAGNWAMMGL